jgi:hypothetical protein
MARQSMRKDEIRPPFSDLISMGASKNQHRITPSAFDCLQAASVSVHYGGPAVSFAHQTGRFNGVGIDAPLVMYDLQELRLIGARCLNARRG